MPPKRKAATSSTKKNDSVEKPTEEKVVKATKVAVTTTAKGKKVASKGKGKAKTETKVVLKKQATVLANDSDNVNDDDNTKTTTTAAKPETKAKAVKAKGDLKKRQSMGIPRDTLNYPSKYTGKSFTAISWNVNGLRSILKKDVNPLHELVEKYNPDVLFLQETKLQESHVAEHKQLIPGYESFWTCSTTKKGYAGSAAFVKQSKDVPLPKVTFSIGAKHDGEGRVILLEYPSFYLLAMYVPNSGQKLERLDYRVKEWDRDLQAFLTQLKKPVVFTGDLNVAHLDADIYNVGAPHVKKTSGCTDEERASFSDILASGFTDAFRYHNKDAKGCFTYWSARNVTAKEENKGLRLDYFIGSNSLFEANALPRIHDSHILEKDTEGFSDHCPVKLTIALE